jgi:hypothetical protein
MLALGIGLVVLAAVGATSTQRSLEADGRASVAPLYLVPFGVLLGAGAAIARGFDLVAAMIVGAVLVPLVGVVGRMVEVRRHRRRTNREG